MSAEDKIRAQVKKRWAHARGCKKPLDACKVCQGNVHYFNELPLDVLAKVLSE